MNQKINVESISGRMKKEVLSSTEIFLIKEGHKLRMTLAALIACMIVVGLMCRILDSDQSGAKSFESLSSPALSGISRTGLQKTALSQNTSLAADLSQRMGIGWIGVEVRDVTQGEALRAGLDRVEGAFIQRVFPGSPAEKSGAQPKDIILSFQSRKIRNAAQFKNDVSNAEPGSEVRMCISRDDYRTTLYATVQEAPPGIPREKKDLPWLGIEVSEVNPESDDMSRLKDEGKEGGVLVRKVIPGSPAQKAGMEPGDVIMSFNSRKVRDVREFLTDLAGARPYDRARVCIMREDIRKTLYPVLEIPPSSTPTGMQASLLRGEDNEEGTRDPGKSLGIVISPLTAALREELSIPASLNGVVVSRVNQTGAAGKAGLLAGDLIKTINFQKTTDMQTFFQAYSDTGGHMILEIYRRGEHKRLNVGLPSAHTL